MLRNSRNSRHQFSKERESLNLSTKELWTATCAALVFPGGSDQGYCRRLNGDGTWRIRQLVEGGGSTVDSVLAGTTEVVGGHSRWTKDYLRSLATKIWHSSRFPSLNLFYKEAC